MGKNKLISLMTILCFLVSFVIAPFAEATQSPRPSARDFKEALDGLIIPSNVGRVTSGRYFGGEKVVINIQDLHCHPEVQRNISRIIEELDRKYKLKAVYLEGGYGDIDTSWLGNLKGREKKDVAETLLDTGRLTGAEYYAAVNDRPNLLKGIEDEQLHRGNIARLGTIIDKKEHFEQTLELLDKDVAFMQAKYFNRRNRKFNAIIRRYQNGDIPAKKYYALLEKYADKINDNPNAFNNIYRIKMENYPNIRGYVALVDKSKHLPYRRISRQLQGFVGILKQKLPYNAYNYLLTRTDNFTRLDTLYVVLARLCREYDIDLGSNYPDLQRFFDYVECGEKVNPIQLIKEEQRLIEEIRIGFSQDVSELEVSFLVDFYGYFKDYLFNRLSADEYKYFTSRFGRFQELWGKYTYVNRLAELKPEFALLDEYYCVNAQRNDRFLKNILGEYLNAGTVTGGSDGEAGVEQTVRSMDAVPEVDVVVTGGFHTAGLEELFANRKISYVSITPNVTQDTKASNAVYERLAKQQAKIASLERPVSAGVSPWLPKVFQTARADIRDTVANYVNIDFRYSDALGLTVASCQPGMEQFKVVAAAAMVKAVRGRNLDVVVRELQDIDRQMGRNDRIVADDNQIKISIDGRELLINKDGTFADDDVAAATSPAANMVQSAATAARGQTVEIAAGIAEWIVDQPAIIGNLLPAMVSVLLWMAGEGYLTGEGPIYELADPVKLQVVASEFAARPEAVAQLPAAIQQAMLLLQEEQELLKHAGNPFVVAIAHFIPVGRQEETLRSNAGGTAGRDDKTPGHQAQEERIPYHLAGILDSIQQLHERLLQLGIKNIAPFALRSVAQRYYKTDVNNLFGQNPQYNTLYMIGINPALFLRGELSIKDFAFIERSPDEFLTRLQNTFIQMMFGNDMGDHSDSLEDSPVFVVFKDKEHGGIEFPNVNQDGEESYGRSNRVDTIEDAINPSGNKLPPRWYSKSGAGYVPVTAEAFSVALSRPELDGLNASIDAYLASVVVPYLRQQRLLYDDDALSFYKKVLFPKFINHYLYAKFLKQLIVTTEADRALKGQSSEKLTHEATFKKGLNAYYGKKLGRACTGAEGYDFWQKENGTEQAKIRREIEVYYAPLIEKEEIKETIADATKKKEFVDKHKPADENARKELEAGLNWIREAVDMTERSFGPALFATDGVQELAVFVAQLFLGRDGGALPEKALAGVLARVLIQAVSEYSLTDVRSLANIAAHAAWNATAKMPLTLGMPANEQDEQDTDDEISYSPQDVENWINGLREKCEERKTRLQTFQNIGMDILVEQAKGSLASAEEQLRHAQDWQARFDQALRQGKMLDFVRLEAEKPTVQQNEWLTAARRLCPDLSFDLLFFVRPDSPFAEIFGLDDPYRQGITCFIPDINGGRIRIAFVRNDITNDLVGFNVIAHESLHLRYFSKMGYRNAFEQQLNESITQYRCREIIDDLLKKNWKLSSKIKAILNGIDIGPLAALLRPTYSDRLAHYFKTRGQYNESQDFAVLLARQAGRNALMEMYQDADYRPLYRQFPRLLRAIALGYGVFHDSDANKYLLKRGYWKAAGKMIDPSFVPEERYWDALQEVFGWFIEGDDGLPCKIDFYDMVFDVGKENAAMVQYTAKKLLGDQIRQQDLFYQWASALASGTPGKTVQREIVNKIKEVKSLAKEYLSGTDTHLTHEATFKQGLNAYYSGELGRACSGEEGYDLWQKESKGEQARIRREIEVSYAPLAEKEEVAAAIADDAKKKEFIDKHNPADVQARKELETGLDWIKKAVAAAEKETFGYSLSTAAGVQELAVFITQLFLKQRDKNSFSEQELTQILAEVMAKAVNEYSLTDVRSLANVAAHAAFNAATTAPAAEEKPGNEQNKEIAKYFTDTRYLKMEVFERFARLLQPEKIDEKNQPEEFEKVRATVSKGYDVIVNEIRAAVDSGNGIYIATLLKYYLTTDQAGGLSLEQVCALAAYSRYCCNDKGKMNASIYTVREINTRINYLIRQKVADETVKDIDCPPDIAAVLKEALVDQYNSSAGALEAVMRDHGIGKATAKKSAGAFYTLKKSVESTIERKAFDINLHQAKEQSRATGTPSVELEIRELLCGDDIYSAWIDDADLGKRLSLTEKFKVLDRCFKAGKITDKSRLAELKLAIAKIHFLDRYDIALLVPFKENTDAKDIPRDADNQPAELISIHETGLLLAHLTSIDRALQKLPYELTGLSKELRKLLLVKSGRAFYRPNWHTMVNGLVQLDITIMNSQAIDFGTLFHEIGHAGTTAAVEMPFLYSKKKLNEWMKKHADTLGIHLNDEQQAVLGDGSDSAGKEASEVLYAVFEQVFRQYMERYNEIEKNVVDEFARKPFNEIALLIGFRESGIESEWDVDFDRYDYVQQIIASNPEIGKQIELVRNKQRVQFLLHQYIANQIARRMGTLYDGFPDALACAYMYRVPRQDRSKHNTNNAIRENANEFIAEYAKLFVLFPKLFKKEDPALYELFEIVYGERKLANNKIAYWKLKQTGNVMYATERIKYDIANIHISEVMKGIPLLWAGKLLFYYVQKQFNGRITNTAVYAGAVATGDISPANGVDESKPALLSQNAGRYSRRLIQGWPQWVALAEVHVRELLPMAFNPAGFDRAHGAANVSRSRAIRMMHASFWLTTLVPGIVLGTAALAGLAVPAVAVAGVVAASVAAGTAISGVLHIRHDMKAGIPVAFFIADNPSAITGNPNLDAGKGYLPVVITRSSQLRGRPQNLGMKVNGTDAWVDENNGILTICVADEGFTQNAVDVIRTLKGYGNISGNNRAAGVLAKIAGKAIDPAQAVVFDYAGDAALSMGLQNMPVVYGAALTAGYGAIVNVHNAEQWPREVAVERSWSPRFGKLGKDERVNASLVMNVKDLQMAGVEKIRLLRSRGAKIYVTYDGRSAGELNTALRTYAVDGVICLDAGVAADTGRVLQDVDNRDMWIAGTSISGENARLYVTIDLETEKGKLATVKPYSIVKVSLGEHFRNLDENGIRAQIGALNQLPASCIVVFNGAEFMENTRTPSNDITVLEIFGVNILELLHIVPASEEEKQEYERGVAYRLEMGEFEISETFAEDVKNIGEENYGAVSVNRGFVEAVQLHAMKVKDRSLRQLFVATVVQRMRARNALARAGKGAGLADDRLEQLLGEMFTQPQGVAVAGEMEQFRKLTESGNTAQVYNGLSSAVSRLKRQARNDPNAASTAIELILLYAEPKTKINLQKNGGVRINTLSTRSILQAA